MRTRPLSLCQAGSRSSVPEPPAEPAKEASGGRRLRTFSALRPPRAAASVGSDPARPFCSRLLSHVLGSTCSARALRPVGQCELRDRHVQRIRRSTEEECVGLSLGLGVRDPGDQRPPWQPERGLDTVRTWLPCFPAEWLHLSQLQVPCRGTKPCSSKVTVRVRKSAQKPLAHA